ncbi:hypothetical protein GGR57DRAFT_307578 [Xylariaceae sp. FL1272]|nr:hypothetical protein GGR57DRAFT_307578 [Xylariaceae sp. FL1272]
MPNPKRPRIDSDPAAGAISTQARANTTNASATSKQQPEPGPPTGGAFFANDKTPESIWFYLCPDPTKTVFNQDWLARMDCKCADVPGLMRTGFHFNMDNVVREEGYIGEHTLGFKDDTGVPFVATRHYFLKDLEQPPRWTAKIEVHSPTWAIVYRFDFSLISPNHVKFTSADSFQNNGIYHYLHGRPEECYNAIYDEMPLEGLWPWPKKESKESSKDKSDSNATAETIHEHNQPLIKIE